MDVCGVVPMISLLLDKQSRPFMAKEFMYKNKNEGVVADEADMDVTNARQIRDHAMIN
jgi:hypothetical protein